MDGAPGEGVQGNRLRPGCLGAVAWLALGAFAVLAVAVLRGGDGGRIDLGRADDYAPGSVVYRATDHLFVVRLTPERAGNGDDLVVLSDLDPHNPPGRRSCRVTFRPDRGEQAAGGQFYDACTGATYDITGRGLSGDGLDLQVLPLTRGDGERYRVRPGS